MRRLFAAGTAVALAISLLLVSPAGALAPTLHFTADSLPTWQTNGTVWGMAAAQGKVFAGGSFTQVRPPGTAEGAAGSLSRSGLVVLDAATGTPTSCVLNVARASSAIVRAVATSPDKNTVYIGGLFDTVNGVARRNLAAINVATCALVPNFNPQPNSFVYAIASTQNAVYFGGNFASVGSQPRSRLGAAASVTATTPGALLPWAPTTDDDVLALAVEPATGNVIIGGRTNSINGLDSAMLGVVDGGTGTTNVHNYPRGFFPWTPGTGQRAGTSVVKTIAVDATGFYVGNEGTGGGIFDGRSAFNWGTYNQRWRDGCLGATQALVPLNGVLFAGSHAHNCESENTFEDGRRHFFTAETTADKQYQPWWPQANDGIGEGIGPRALTMATAGTSDFLWAGGEFTQINGIAQRGLARFGQGPDTGAPVAPAVPNVASLAPGQATVTWRTTTDDDDATLTYTLYRGTSTTPIATLQADSQFYLRPQLSFTDTGLTPGQVVSYRVKASDGINTSAFSASRSVTIAATTNAYAAGIVGDGASVYFRMEEPNGTVAGSLGSSAFGGGYQNASTRVGQSGALLSQPGQSALFDGVSSFLRTEVRTQAPRVYSVETWFKTTTTTGGRIVGFGNRANMNEPNGVPLSLFSDRQLYMTNDGRVMFGVSASSRLAISSAAGLNNGQWHHAVGTQGPAGMALYIDGDRVARNSVSAAQAYQGYWRIGGDTLFGWPSRPTSNFFAGNIDETAIYPAVLTAAQIANHYRLSGRSLPGDPTDTQAPTPPTGLTATATGTTVALSWTASTDNVGVAGYEVHRSSTTGFTASAATKIADVAPSATPVTFSDAARPPGTWFYRVVARDAAGNASVGSGQAQAVVVAPDGQPPTVPTGLTATATGPNVALSWTASTDNVGVAKYEVHRSSTTGFAVAAANKIADVTSGVSYSDLARPAGTWFYRVVAVDAAGNASAGSTQAQAVVTGGAAQMVVLSPTEDTYAVQASPTTNFGTSASMNSRGGPSSFVAYLKFAVPAGPVGTSLVGATLSVRTTTDAAAGSADPHVVSLSSNSWTEIGIDVECPAGSWHGRRVVRPADAAQHPVRREPHPGGAGGPAGRRRDADGEFDLDGQLPVLVPDARVDVISAHVDVDVSVELTSGGREQPPPVHQRTVTMLTCSRC